MIKRTKTNFTLIELLVVMLLMGFLITLMLPGFNRMISGNKVDQMASNLKLALEQAQSHAITSRRYVALVLPSNSSDSSWTDEEKRHCFGGYRMAYVKNSGSTATWKFQNWVPDSIWKNAPDGAMLVEVVGSANSSEFKDQFKDPGKGLSDAITSTKTSLGDKLLTISEYKYDESATAASRANCAVIFSPCGGVKGNEDLRFVIAEAIPNGDNLLFPSRDNNGPTNYLVLNLNRFTGKVDYLSIQ